MLELKKLRILLKTIDNLINSINEILMENLEFIIKNINKKYPLKIKTYSLLLSHIISQG